MAKTDWTKGPNETERSVTELQGAIKPRLMVGAFIAQLYHNVRPGQNTPDPRRVGSWLADVDDRANGMSLIRSVIDTDVSLTCPSSTVNVTPVGAEFSRQKSCKMLGRFIEGVEYVNGYRESRVQARLDACKWPIAGLLWFVDESKEIRSRRLDPRSIVWDDTQAPDWMDFHVVEHISRDVLRADWSKNQEALNAIAATTSDTVPRFFAIDPVVSDEDRVRVIRSWRCKRGKAPGKWAVQIGRFRVAEGEWNHPRPPIAFLRWGRQEKSFGGESLGEAIKEHHLWYNKVTRLIYDAQEGAVPRILEHESALLSELSNRAWKRVKWSGPRAPEFITPTGLNPETYQWREQIKRDAFEEAGVNLNAAQGSKPPGITAAVAINAWQDISNTRLKQHLDAMEDFDKQSAEAIIWLAVDTYGKDGKARVMAPGTALLDEIVWSDIGIGNLRESEYSVRVSPMSGLPLTMAARQQAVSDLVEKFGLPPARGLRMLQIPDVETTTDRLTSDEDLAEKQVEAALWEGKYMPVEPYQNPQLVLDIGMAEYRMAIMNGTFPEENVEALRKLIESAKRRLESAAPPPPSPAPAPPGAAPSQPVEAGAPVA